MCVIDRCGMPIVARQPGSPSSTVGRSGDGSSTGHPAPSADLLPTDVAATPASALAPHRALALDALHVFRTLRDRPRDAGPWGVPAFAGEVEQVRAQLAPIRDRRGLAASFGREAFRTLGALETTERPAGIGAVRVAYAIRWLELGRGVRQPAWSTLVADRVPDRA